MLLTGGHCYFTWDNWDHCTCTCDSASGHGDDWYDAPGCSRLSSSKVHRYTRDQGWMEDLLDMTVGRYGHGCAAFTVNQEQVRDQRSLQFLLNAFQIYLVAGGCGRWQFLADAVSHTDTYRDEECIEYLASTEVYRGGLWITVEPLPVAVMGVRGASLDNTVYMTGEQG